MSCHFIRKNIKFQVYIFPVEVFLKFLKNCLYDFLYIRQTTTICVTLTCVSFSILHINLRLLFMNHHDCLFINHKKSLARVATSHPNSFNETIYLTIIYTWFKDTKVPKKTYCFVVVIIKSKYTIKRGCAKI